MSYLHELKTEFHRKVVEVVPECVNDPELFDPDHYPRNAKDGDKTMGIPNNLESRMFAEKVAKDICGRCEMRQLCLEYAVATNDQYLIWGGTTPEERQKIKIRKTPRNLA